MTEQTFRSRARRRHAAPPRRARPASASSLRLPHWRLLPLTEALAVALFVVGTATVANDAWASPGSNWFAAGSGTQARPQHGGPMPGGAGIPSSARQQIQARQQLSRSIENLGRTASAIAAQQASQEAARAGARNEGWVRDGLGVDGLDRLAGGRWDAAAPETAQANGREQVVIRQNKPRAILEWNSFHVGRNTDLTFVQSPTDAVLNKVMGDTRPSQIQGAIRADGTVMVVNQNGVVFTGSSQVNVRNLAVAAASISNSQFESGLYGANNQATFTQAAGKVLVEQGARIATADPQSSTSGGGYVLLAGKEVDNAGVIHTPKGQALLAAGDSFVIKRGQGTEGNQQSTTRGNEVTVSGTGVVRNHGLIQSPQGDITLTANTVEQRGVLAASTSVNQRGTIHLTAAGAGGQITLASNAVTAILVDASDSSALDSQRDGLQSPVLDGTDSAIVPGDTYRRDLSLARISGAIVDFQGGSLTLATGGQVAVEASQRALLREGAVIDVAGAVGVAVAMQANSVQVNIQGNEQRDAPVNRESGNLNSSNVWVDVRDLVFVPAGTNGYATDRWYTKGGLLEVSGYLGTQAHSAGQWLAQGGTAHFTGNELVAQAGSIINLSGGTLDVQDGYVRQSWLRGEDGRLYEVSSAPGDVRYAGLYKGYEISSARWGHTRIFYDPMMAPGQRWESGYTVGRDAGTLVIGTRQAVFEGDIVSDTFQGDRQTQAAQAGLDGYYQSQRAVARAGNLVVGSYLPYYVKDSGTLQHRLTANANTIQNVVLGNTAESVAAGLNLDGVLPQDRQGTLYLDVEQLNRFGLGGLRIAASNQVTVDGALHMGRGGDVVLYGPSVSINADVVSVGGSIHAGNVLHQISANARFEDTILAAPAGTTANIAVADGVKIDLGGRWSNLLLAPEDNVHLPYQDGGDVSLRSTGAISLGDASLIDVSSGAAVTASRQSQGGKGGNVLLDAGANGGTHALSLGGAIRAHGVTGGGQLDLRAARVVIGNTGQVDEGTLVLDAGFFDKGFSAYQVTGRQGLTVAQGVDVNVLMPVYRHRVGSLDAASSVEKSEVLEVWTPPLYQEDPVALVLRQRAGASLSLHAGTTLSSVAERASVQAQVERGATLSVDPGQAIEIRSIGQLSVDGRLNAWGGRIELGSVDARVDGAGHGRSIWIGESAMLDVAGRATTAIGQGGRRYGQVSAGGEIVIGGVFDEVAGVAGRQNANTQGWNADDAFVVVRQGAILDASGASAVLDVPGRAAASVNSAGGAITLASSNGLYLDGMLSAMAGGAGAAGGSLTVVLDTPYYSGPTAGARVRHARELVLRQEHPSSQLPAGTRPVDIADALVYGHAALGVNQIASGGFDRVTLASDGVLGVGNGVSLAVGQSLNLHARVLAPLEDQGVSRAVLSAPYVRLTDYGGNGSRDGSGDNLIHPTLVSGGTVSSRGVEGSLAIQASQLLDVGGVVAIGGRSGAAASTGLPQVVDRRGFEHVTLSSGGDLRLLGGTFYTSGDLTLAAAQLYPLTQATAILYAGWQGQNMDFDPVRTLSVARTTQDIPAAPYSVFGSLTLGAKTIQQGGVIRAPLGTVALGVESGQQRRTDTVTLLPGGLTSVSAAGLVMPYGGTTDGITWQYANADVGMIGAGGVAAAHVELLGKHVDVQSGAIIDLSGGGELRGAGFVSGRGGSTDARYHPLMRSGPDGLTLPGLASNPVYAILPGVQARAASGDAASTPALGQQITIGTQDIPGLPAGTYTLLPSSYALLPGAYRVEINGLAGHQAQTNRSNLLRNGSYVAAGTLSVAGTGIRDSLASQVTLTPADTLRKYSQYNETSYADFVRNDALTQGVPRAVIEADAKNLWLRLIDRDAGSTAPSLRFDGTVQGSAGQGGRGSTLSLLASGTGKIEIRADGSVPSPDFGVSVQASDLGRIDVNRLVIGGAPMVEYGQGGNLVRFNSWRASGITVRSGATLAAPEVLLITVGNSTNREAGAIVIEQGAAINALGQGTPAFSSSDGFLYQPGSSSIVAVSNGRQQWLAPEPSGVAASGPIRIGACVSVSCTGTTQLYSEGTIAFVTDNSFQFDDAVRYGTRHLSLAVGAFNIGGNEALAMAEANGTLTPGLVLNQSVMSRLLQGDTSVGAPALQTLELIAGQSVNFFDTVTLSTRDANGKSLLDNLMLTAPAIYGAGTVGDVARIQTGHLIWNGASGAPGGVVTGGAGTGQGVFQVEADRVTFGYGPWGQPDGVSEMKRLALGFTDVNLYANDRITANNQGTLSVYQHQGSYVAGEGYRYSGGNLNLIAPLVTGEAGAVNRIVAGGNIALSSPVANGAPSKTVMALGAELALTAGQALRVDSAVALPSGKLVLKAAGDVSLGDRAYLDLSGRAVTFFDDAGATQYSWGGDARLESTSGNIHQAQGSIVDLSAVNNQAGRLTVVALDGNAGTVALQGRILGRATGYYEAGGTYVPYQQGGLTVHAQNLGGPLSESFAALNQRLNEGEVFGLRSFQLKQGDLVVGNELRANQIDVSVDGGHLTVVGTVDASGEQVGTIRLAGKQGFTLAGNALLDAHGTLLRLDSYGQIIEAPNRAIIELSSGNGTLTVAAGARMDLRFGTADARVQQNPALHDGRRLGMVTLNAPRVDAAGNANTAAAATHGDIAIDVRGPVTIDGAKSIAVNAVQRYNDAPDGSDAAAGGKPYQVITQDYLDEKHLDSRDFISSALANGALLQGKLAGLNNDTYRNALHLRPGVHVVSQTAEGDLVVSGDVDLSGYRYDSLNPLYQKTAVYGSGEPGSLVIRAGGNLSVYGSVSDGFAPPPDTPDDNGWVLTPGVQGYGGDVIVPGAGVSLAAGTIFPAGKTLNYAIPIQALTLPSGMTLPTPVSLVGSLTLPAGTVLRADILNGSGQVLHAAGSVLGVAVVLPANAVLGAGTVLPAATQVAAMEWPAGVALPVDVTLSGNLALKVGALIPSRTNVKLVGGALSVPLRPVNNGRMGRNWAVAAMLPEGSLSWDLRLVAGSDLEAADTRMTLPLSDARMVLADTHFSLFGQRQVVVIPGTPAQPGGQYYWTNDAAPRFTPGTPVPANRLSSCTSSPNLCVLVRYLWSEDAAPRFTPGTPVPDNRLSTCTSSPNLCVSLGQDIPGTPDRTTVGSNILKVMPVAQNFSVLRTGTGSLDLIAGGDVAMHSPYGIYTAGTHTAARAGAEADAFNRSRGKVADGSYLSTRNSAAYVPDGGQDPGRVYESLVDGSAGSPYAAWYPDGGGNLLLRVGGDLTGDMHAIYNPVSAGQDLRPQRSSVNLGNWLWRQGSGQTAGVEPIATSWWINFGTYVTGAPVMNSFYGLDAPAQRAVAAIPELVGFTGIGTLGGGNLDIQVSGNAGLIDRRGGGSATEGQQRSQGIVAVVGSSGRVLESGNILLTGGGDLRFAIGGDLNSGLNARAVAPLSNNAVQAKDYRRQNVDLNGMLGNLRGSVGVQSGEVGGVALTYFSTGSPQTDGRETRPYDPYTASLGTSTGGPVLIVGDATATLSTRGDLVVSGTGDAGRAVLPYTLPYDTSGGRQESGGLGWFSLWTDNTAINLFSAGGDLTPSVELREVTTAGSGLAGKNHSATDGRFVWPGQLRAVAADGSVFLGKSALGGAGLQEYNAAYSLLLAPSDQGKLELLAGDSIYAGGYVVSRSAASKDALPTPFNPAFAVFTAGGGLTAVHNLSQDGIRPERERLPIFTFGANTVSSALDAMNPVRIYAARGDVLGLGVGEIVSFSTTGARPGQTWYEGAGPVWMRAGRDIVRAGSLIGVSVNQQDLMSTPFSTAGTATSMGNLFIHGGANDVSIVEAGRDIILSNFNVAGPGTLEISAGRNIVMAGQAEGAAYGETRVRSLGPLAVGDSRRGADVVVQAGLGQGGGDYAGFLKQYLDAANLANPQLPLAEQTGKVVRTYEAELLAWLLERYGFEPSSADTARAEAGAFFSALPMEQQRPFARQIYFAELRAGGREYNDVDSPRFGSYLRGRNAIAALFPEQAVSGEALVYQGDLLMYGGAGVHTELGGDIQILTPGGGQTYGIEGGSPPATAGLITRGDGNIDLYSLESILLGQSRIMTTFGGSILAWSATGDINAGRGAKTTVVYTPPRRTYDDVGNVILSPQVPSTGAGIATDAPIPEVPPGDVDLIAPLGTIDAGEAGIRFSGNANFAAMQVANAANIVGQGEATGIPVIAAVNIGALTSASTAASAASTAAQDTAARTRADAQRRLPSIISVQILGFGEEGAQPSSSPEPRAQAPRQAVGYNPNSTVQLLGNGALGESDKAQLTARERANAL